MPQGVSQAPAGVLVNGPCPGESGLASCGQYDRADMGDFQGEVMNDAADSTPAHGYRAVRKTKQPVDRPLLWSGEPGQQGAGANTPAL